MCGTCMICGGVTQRTGTRGRVPMFCPGACRRTRLAQLEAGYRAAKPPRPRAVLPMNVCIDCHSEFAPTFHSHGGAKQPKWCPSCWKIYDFKLRSSRYDRRRAKRHGLTEIQLSELLKSQGGTCAIAGCDRMDDGAGRSLHIDHDHDCCPGAYSCGKCVRGLLCGQHNVGIGYFDNDTEALHAAIVYLTARRLTAVSA